MKDQNYLGVCVIIASAIIGASIVWHAFAQRYQLVKSENTIYVQDTVTGETYIGGKTLVPYYK